MPSSKQDIVLYVFLNLVLFTQITLGENSPPPPLPEHVWRDTSLNYAELHSKYAEALQCMVPPQAVGVYGYWHRVMWAVSASLSFTYTYHMHELENRTYAMLNFLAAVAPAAFSTFILFQQVEALRTCIAYTAPFSKNIRGLNIFTSIVSIVYLMGLYASALLPLEFINSDFKRFLYYRLQQIGAFGITIAAALQFIIINAALDLPTSPKTLPKHYVPGLPIWLPVSIILVFYALRCFYKAITSCCLKFWKILKLVVVIVLVYFDGTSALRLGMVLGDPYGSSYITGNWMNLVDVVLLGVIPVLQLAVYFSIFLFSEPEIAPPQASKLFPKEKGVANLLRLIYNFFDLADPIERLYEKQKKSDSYC